MTLKERLVLRCLGIKISDDGMRWTAPRKRQEVVERAFFRVVDNAWREGKDVEVNRAAGGSLRVTGPKGTITLRWLP
jgi:hypothetical protein